MLASAMPRIPAHLGPYVIQQQGLTKGAGFAAGDFQGQLEGRRGDIHQKNMKCKDAEGNILKQS